MSFRSFSLDIDFGEKWFGIKCSKNYFDEIAPYFNELKKLKSENIMWRDIENKDEKYYVPILNAFMKELKSQFDIHGDIITKKMIGYLIGTNDFYKLISISSQKITRIIPFNMYGSLNQSATDISPCREISILELPTRVVELNFKKNSKTTLELIMDYIYT